MTDLAYTFFIIFYGLCMGSFVSLLSYRWPRGMNWISDRSRCPACGEKLAARDLIPVVSWLINRAKCRLCAAPVSARYPLLEIGAAFISVGLYLLIGWQWLLLPVLIAQPFVMAGAIIFYQAIRSASRAASEK